VQKRETAKSGKGEMAGSQIQGPVGGVPRQKRQQSRRTFAAEMPFDRTQGALLKLSPESGKKTKKTLISEQIKEELEEQSIL